MEQENTLFLDMIDKALVIPGVKVNREEFLIKVFEKEDNDIKNLILKEGPIKAGIERKKLNRIAKKIVNNQTLVTSTASFAAGLPGGLALAGTIPADMLQFYGIALRLIQKLAFVYGDEEMVDMDEIDSDTLKNRIIIYCGVMFGVSGTVATLKLTSSMLSKQVIKKLPQKALTKTVYYPIVKKIALKLGLQMNKDIFAKNVGKAIPVVGGVISGGLTFASMRKGGMRIVEALDSAMYEYGEDEINADLKEVFDIVEEEVQDVDDIEFVENEESVKEESTLDITSKIKEAKQLLDDGIITEEEFKQIKEKIIKSM